MDAAMTGLNIVTGISALLPLIVGYSLIKKNEKDPILKIYKFAMIGLMPVAILHLTEVLYGMGLLEGENVQTLISYIDDLVFLFLTGMITYGLYSIKKDILIE